jgi:hypothetical protein
MLKDTKTFLADAVGTQETISLQSKNAVIASAFYGLDTSNHPVKATIADDRKSLNITIISGVNALVVTLASPVDDQEVVTLFQGDPDDNPLDFITVSAKVGAGSILIQGN